jgi:hypothetical protein
MLHGPFHRLESPTQTSADAVRQVKSGEIWGRPARWSNIPSVKAYRQRIPPGERGVEFTTPVAPHPGSGSPYEARWYYPHTPGVLLKQDANNDDYAVIPADVVNHQP